MERMECGSSQGENSDAEMRPLDHQASVLVTTSKPTGKQIKIREQLEFYFSDSNLSKDRFLLNEIKTNSKDGYVDLKLFLRFNKIIALTSSADEIAESIGHSKILQLDETGKMVKRRIEYVPPSQADIDNRTVYAENAFGDADRIKKLFAKFGKVAYVSVPKFKTTNHTKGFAFVEFEEQESATECIKALAGNLEGKQITGKFPKNHIKLIDLEKKIGRLQETIRSYETSGQVTEDQSKAPQADAEKSTDVKEKEADEEKKKLKPLEAVLVISKNEWLKMKEAYLKNQEDRIGELKKELDRLTQLLADRKEEKIKSQNDKVKTDDITRGSIVKVLVDLNNEEEYKLFKLSRQQFKDQKLKGPLEEHVVYVDLDKGSCKIFVRCKNKESAEAVLNSADFLAAMNKQLLSAEEEEAYFERIFANRHKKLEKKDKKQTQPEVVRPKDLEPAVKPIKKAAPEPAANAPPAKKAASHIKFDDDDD